MQVCCFGKLRKSVQAESHLPENLTSVPASRYWANLRANRTILPPLLLKIDTDFRLDRCGFVSLSVGGIFSIGDRDCHKCSGKNSRAQQESPDFQLSPTESAIPKVGYAGVPTCGKH
jgi:hypothetical protein